VPAGECQMSKRGFGQIGGWSFLQAVSRSMRRGLGHKIGVSLAIVSLASSLYAPVAMGQVITDPRAPIQFKPKVGVSANGTPVVDIAKPTFGGISHNKFQRYDVDTRGVILNNSKLTGTSIIGGKVVANPNLVGQRPARVILNEVTSSATSTLNGPTEVFGSKADVIIANPNGVGCVGCTFINSGRVTLSTGTPIPDYNRGTVKFDVSRGTVSVAGKGLLGVGSPIEDVDLIARQLKIDGPIEAKDRVRLRAGGMIYDQRGDQVSPKPLSTLPVIDGPAIQSSASGKIVAGTLSVLSRDVDVGIDLKGDLTAYADSITIKSFGDASVASAKTNGDLQLEANGQITLTGNSQALGRVTAAGKHIIVTVDGQLVAGDAIVMEALQSLATRGVLKAGNAISLVSGDQLIAEGLIASNGEIAFEGKAISAKNLEVSGRNVSVAGLESAVLDNTAIVSTHESVKIAGQKLELGEGTFFQSKKQLVIDAKDQLTNATVLNYGNLDLSIRNSFINKKTGQLVQDIVLLTLRDKLDNAGTIYGREKTIIEADLLSNGDTGVIFGPEISLNVTRNLNNLGKVLSERTLKIVAGDVLNNGTIQTNEALNVKARSYRAESASARLAAAATDIILSDILDNAGTIYGSGSLSVVSGALTNRGASSAIGGGVATITVNGNLSNQGGISANGSLNLTVHGTVANAGRITTDHTTTALATAPTGDGGLVLNADGAITSSGTVAATGKLTITGASLANDSTSAKLGGSTVDITLAGDFSNKGLVNGGTNLAITSRGFFNGPLSGDAAGIVVGDRIALTAMADVENRGLLQAEDALTIDGKGGFSNSGSVLSEAGLLIDVDGAINNQKEIAAAALTLKGLSYTGAAGSSLNGVDITIDLLGAFTNAGKIDARSILDLTTTDVTNAAGGVIGADGILLTAKGGLTNAGTLKSQDTGLITVAGKLTNTGDLVALKDLSLTVGGALDNRSVIQAKDKLIIAAGPVTNRSGARLQAERVAVTSSGAITNAGTIDGTEEIYLKAKSLKNEGASAKKYASISTKDLTVDLTGSLTIGTNSLLQGKDDATIKAKSVTATIFTNDTTAQGRFVAGNNLDFTLTSGGWTFNDNLKIKGDLRFKVAGTITNLATIASGGSMSLESTSGSIINGANDPAAPGGGLIFSGGDMVLKAKKNIANYASTIQSMGNLVIEAGGDVINTRTATKTVDDGSSPDTWGNWKYTSYYTRDYETSGPSTIQAQGSILIKADEVKNVASTVAAGSNLTINARKVEHLARTLYRRETVIKTGGTVNIGKVMARYTHALSETPALFYAGGVIDVNTTAGYTHTGTVQARQVIIKGPHISIGVSGTSGTAPSRIPDPVIDLADAIGLLGAGLVRGSGPAYVSGAEGATSGTVKFLYATPVASGKGTRNPSWIFAQTGANATNLTFFADPLTEQRLIQQALLEQTGRAILDPKYRNPQEQQEALYKATVDFVNATGIKLGDKLTKAQRAKITKPILWYEYQIIDGKKVLVPQLILPEKDLAKYASVNGGAIFAEDIDLQGDKVTNTGTLLAINTLSIDAKEFLNEKRVGETGNWQSPYAAQAGGVLGAKNIFIKTTGDLINRGGTITAGNYLQMTAGGDIRLEAQKVTNQVYAGNTKNWTVTTDVKHVGGLVSSGGNLVIKAEKKLDILGSTVTAKNDALLVGKTGVTIASVLDRHEVVGGGKKSGFLSKSSHSSYDMSATNLSSVVSAGKNLTVRSETGDITVAASHLMAKNDLAVLAGYDENGNAVKGSKASVNVLSEQDVRETAFSQKKSGVGLFFSGSGVDIYRSTKVASTTSEARNVASSLSADGNLVVKATRDIAIMGSVVAAKGTVTIDAKRDVLVGTGMDASGSTSSRKEKGIGLTWSGGNGGFSVGAGYHASSQYSAYDKVSVAQSIIKGDKGVSIKAGDDITMVAASVVSKGHVSLDAKDDIKLLAGLNRESSYQSSKEIFAGITLKVSQNVTGAAQQLQQSASTFTSGYGGSGYKILGQVSGVLQATDALKSLTNPSVNASLMLGASGSKSQSQAVAYNAVPTSIKAGSFSMTAGGDAHLVGTQVNVKNDILIDVKGNLKVESAQSYAEASSKAESWNAGVGISGSLGASGGGLGITVEGGFSKDKSSSWSLTQLNAHLNSQNGTVTIKTGKNATFAGAVVKGDTIDLDIGGNLTVESRQDQSHNASSSVNGSGTATIGIGGSPSSVSVSGGGGKSTSDSAWVTEQSGFYAKDKLDVYVEKHTQLNGAVLNSSTGNLTLDTGTLGFKDIQDYDKGTSINGQVGVTLGSQTLPNGQTPTSTGVNVSGSYEMHDIEQVTQATIGTGEIVIRDKDKQKQDVANINRNIEEAQVITKNERAGVQVYASSNAVEEIASGFEGIQHNIKDFENLPANVKNGIDQIVASGGIIGKSIDQALGGILDQVSSPNGARIGAALKNGELDYEALAASLSKCGQYSFNLHDLLFTPAYASGGCPVKLSNGETIYLTKSEQDSCWYAAGLVAKGILERATIGHKAAQFGFAAGALDAAGADVRAMGDLGAYAVALTYSPDDPRRVEAELFFGEMRNQVVNILKDPASALKGAAVDVINSVKDKTILYEQAAARGDYIAMGRIEGELAYEIGSLIASGGAGAVTTKTLAKAVPKIAAAVQKGFAKTADLATRKVLFKEMAAAGVKFSPEKVLAVTKLSDGKIIFLEAGTDRAGLKHILMRHELDFTNKGIATPDIAKVVMDAVKGEKIVGKTGSAPVFEVTYNGQKKYIAVGVGNNGYIVRANPVSEWVPL
jgi:filamentous hemagglutinin